MGNGVFLLVTAFILIVTTWFDDALKRLSLRKDYALMTVFSVLVMNALVFDPMPEFQINPACFLLAMVLITGSAQTGQSLAWVSCAIMPIAFVFNLFVLYALPSLGVELAAVIIAIFFGGALYKRPLFAMLCCSLLPLLTYAGALTLEMIAYVPYISPNIESVFDAQIISVISCAIMSYSVNICVESFRQRKQSQAK